MARRTDPNKDEQLNLAIQASKADLIIQTHNQIQEKENIVQALINSQAPSKDDEDLATVILLSGLDKKMTLAGKLVMAEEQSLQVSSTLDHPEQMTVRSTNLTNEQFTFPTENMFKH